MDKLKTLFYRNLNLKSSSSAWKRGVSEIKREKGSNRERERERERKRMRKREESDRKRARLNKHFLRKIIYIVSVNIIVI
jgi:hypothetical protein